MTHRGSTLFSVSGMYKNHLQNDRKLHKILFTMLLRVPINMGVGMSYLLCSDSEMLPHTAMKILNKTTLLYV